MADDRVTEPGAPAPDVPELSADERARLAGWTPPPPPAGFADRVLAARRAAPTVRPPAPTPLPRPLVIAALVVSAACAGAVAMAALRGLDGAPDPARGSSQGDTRRSIALGGRGVAVAEAGAALAWTVDGAARVEQTSGSVFYRVEPGGPFTVVTPAGEIRATGTCFAVEIQPMMPARSILLSGAAGAALAAIAVVSVYEGGVIVVGTAASPGERRVAAGERVELGTRPDPAAAPVAGADVLARDQAQRARIAALEQQVATLTESTREPAWIDLPPAELAKLAAECRVLMDAPSIFESEPGTIEPALGARLGLSAADVAAVDAVIRDVHGDYREQLRALYVEVTGDSAGAEALSPRALFQEIEDKSAVDEGPRARRRIARERAGLEVPPADGAGQSALERALRAQLAVGDATERGLAAHFGAERAHALRRGNEIFENRGSFGGCPRE
jgi:hypothetical protein